VTPESSREGLEGKSGGTSIFCKGIREGKKRKAENSSSKIVYQTTKTTEVLTEDEEGKVSSMTACAKAIQSQTLLRGSRYFSLPNDGVNSEEDGMKSNW